MDRELFLRKVRATHQLVRDRQGLERWWKTVALVEPVEGYITGVRHVQNGRYHMGSSGSYECGYLDQEAPYFEQKSTRKCVLVTRSEKHNAIRVPIGYFTFID